MKLWHMAALIGLALVASGCGAERRRRQAAEEQVDCVYRAIHNGRITDSERTYLARGCQAIYQMKSAAE